MYELFYDIERKDRITISIGLNEEDLYTELNKIEKPSQVFIITDNRVAELHYKLVYDLLDYKTENITRIVVPEGEKFKTMMSVLKIMNILYQKKANRNSLILALGGGIIGDLAGFTASIYKRGMRFINIPTTLLAQIDSCLGGKTGVNLDKTKNIIGSFYNPEKIIIFPKFLKTLEKRQLNAAWGEIIKYHFLGNLQFKKFLYLNSQNIIDLNAESLKKLISFSLQTKFSYIKDDLSDYKERHALNLGHTIAHAVEKLSENRILHGEAVIWGIYSIISFSIKINKAPESVMKELMNLFKRMPIQYLRNEVMKLNIDKHKFLEVMEQDKKNNRKENIKLIVFDRNAKIKEHSLKSIEESTLINSIESFYDFMNSSDFNEL